MQEIFVQVFRKLDGFKGESAVGTWIDRVAINQCLDFLRGPGGEGTSRMIDPIEDEGALAGRRGPLRADRLDLERAIARLPPGYRAASCCMTWKGSNTRRSPASWASRKDPNRGAQSAHEDS